MSAPAVTPKQLGAFLEFLADGHTIRHACVETGLSRATMYRLRKAKPQIAEAWDEALDVGIEVLEQEARRRAVDGFDRPVTVAGKRELVRDFSDQLLIFLLKAKRPAVYREHVQLQHVGSDGGPVKHEHVVETVSEFYAELDRLGAEAERKQDEALAADEVLAPNA